MTASGLAYAVNDGKLFSFRILRPELTKLLCIMFYLNLWIQRNDFSFILLHFFSQKKKSDNKTMNSTKC